MTDTRSASDPSFLALQAAVAGRFSLESELGRGGMGIVYLARDVILERPVAIKLLAPALASRDDMRRRFLREARLAAQCFHPHIVPIHEVAEDGALAWFVMGYVHGETLADRLRRVGTLSAEQIRRIGSEVGWALSYAHERGVIHRDVKPDNILLEHGTDRALIADFGIAVGGDVSASGNDVAGTTRFMAPEQALGERLDGRADLYALGVTLYLAATGTYPYNGANVIALVAEPHAVHPLSLRERARSLPPTLADTIERCLAVRASDRYDSAAAFVAALTRAPDGGELPVEARQVRGGAVSTMSLMDWFVALALTSFFWVAGEDARTLGRAIMSGLAQAILTMFGTAVALRGGETLLAARRALKQGVRPDDVANALAPPPAEPFMPVGPLKQVALLGTGFTLALLQAQVDTLGLPSIIELAGHLLTWIAPPLLIHRAITGMRNSSGQTGWLYAFVRQPLAARVVRWLGGARAPERTRAVPANAPTELLLDRAAHDIFARLPQAVQHDLAAVPAAAEALAHEAVVLRTRADALSGEQRVLRRAPSDDTDAQRRLTALQAKHAQVRARLGTTIAALEAIRLDLLRLEASQTVPGNLTDQLDVVRELQHRVDANAEVRRLLQPLCPEPTPV
ncbi:serine/threonine-protein kinase [Gemmatimonas sp.]|uniref:serine/threonine-protein kinase n=1 Tax=Gemmatimonas sp. TaxID=1962908 RepID=UPI0037BFC862